MIKRFVEIDESISLSKVNIKTWELILHINLKYLELLLLEMYLLEYGLSQSLTVKSKSTSETIIFNISENTDKKTSSFDQITNKFKVILSINDFKCISSFLLQYYRDSSAPVDHIHIDIDKNSNLGNDGTLTIVAEDSVKPMSGEEAKKILMSKE